MSKTIWIHKFGFHQLFGKINNSSQTVSIDEKEVEKVDCFIYLGTSIDSKLTFNDHAENVFKKANQRLSLLRKLRSFDVSQHILVLVYMGREGRGIERASEKERVEVMATLRQCHSIKSKDSK